MVSRERILEAASRVYAKHGFKGATTRLIANEAGVNEVTLFRTFGSKSALLQAVLIQHVGTHAQPAPLPAVPSDPRTELRDFIDAHLQKMAELRPLLLHSMSEIEERPEAHEFACRGKEQVHDSIATYVRQLQASGLAAANADPDVAALMLSGCVVSDVMGRAIVPHLYPPLEEVAERYTALFLRAIGVRDQAAAGSASSTAQNPPLAESVGSSTRSTDTQPHPHP